MTIKDEAPTQCSALSALRMALEALESCVEGDYSTSHVIHPYFDVHDVNRAITAIREALRASGEVLAWVPEEPQPEQKGCMRCNTPKKCALYGCSPLTWPAEQPTQPERPAVPAVATAIAQGEPVAWRYALDASVEGPRWIYIDKGPHKWLQGPEMVNALIEPLYTTPQPAVPERKPLTDEEIKRMAAKWFLSMYWPLCNTFARAIEAAHGIYAPSELKENK